jgi:hypothetical protein
MTIGKNMKIVTTYWGNDKSFKLMPVTLDCPYMEVIYDPTTDMLVVITRNMKENLQLVPKLDDDGNQIRALKPKQNGRPWKEKHVQMTVPQEFYLIEREEQIELIKELAVNGETFDFQKYFTDLDKSMAENVLIKSEAPGLVDENGLPIAAKKSKKAPLSIVAETPEEK